MPSASEDYCSAGEIYTVYLIWTEVVGRPGCESAGRVGSWTAHMLLRVWLHRSLARLSLVDRNIKLAKGMREPGHEHNTTIHQFICTCNVFRHHNRTIKWPRLWLGFKKIVVCSGGTRVVFKKRGFTAWDLLDHACAQSALAFSSRLTVSRYASNHEAPMAKAAC